MKKVLTFLFLTLFIPQAYCSEWTAGNIKIDVGDTYCNVGFDISKDNKIVDRESRIFFYDELEDCENCHIYLYIKECLYKIVFSKDKISDKKKDKLIKDFKLLEKEILKFNDD